MVDENETKHTATPWVVAPMRGYESHKWLEVRGNDGHSLVVGADAFYQTSNGETDTHFGVKISEADARRLVACVNAAEGIPTETLEALARIGGWATLEVPGKETVPAKCRKCRAKRTFRAFDAFYEHRGVDEGKPGKKHGPAPKIEPPSLLAPVRGAKGTPR